MNENKYSESRGWMKKNQMDKNRYMNEKCTAKPHMNEEKKINKQHNEKNKIYDKEKTYERKRTYE